VRATRLELARAVAKAENKAELIGVLGSFERYVDRVLAATGK
jgi:hypothetical protein